MRTIKIIIGLCKGMLLWSGIILSIIGCQYPQYQYLGLGLILTYSILNEITQLSGFEE